MSEDYELEVSHFVPAGATWHDLAAVVQEVLISRGAKSNASIHSWHAGQMVKSCPIDRVGCDFVLLGDIQIT